MQGDPGLENDFPSNKTNNSQGRNMAMVLMGS